MKRTALIFTLTVLVAVAAIAAPPAPPQQGGRGPASAPQHGPAELLPPGAFAEFLGLTDAQKSSIESLRATLEHAVEPLREQQRANQEAIEAALAANDAARAGQLVLANYKIAQQMRAAHETFRNAFEALLTSEQKAKLAVYQEIVELRRNAGPRD